MFFFRQYLSFDAWIKAIGNLKQRKWLLFECNHTVYARDCSFHIRNTQICRYLAFGHDVLQIFRKWNYGTDLYFFNWELVCGRVYEFHKYFFCFFMWPMHYDPQFKRILFWCFQHGLWVGVTTHDLKSNIRSLLLFSRLVDVRVNKSVCVCDCVWACVCTCVSVCVCVCLRCFHAFRIAEDIFKFFSFLLELLFSVSFIYFFHSKERDKPNGKLTNLQSLFLNVLLFSSSSKTNQRSLFLFWSIIFFRLVIVCWSL